MGLMFIQRHTAGKFEYYFYFSETYIIQWDANVGDSSTECVLQGPVESKQYPHCFRLSTKIYQIRYIWHDCAVDICGNDLLHVLLA